MLTATGNAVDSADICIECLIRLHPLPQELSRLEEKGIRLHSTQRDALKRGLTQRVALIQGPPGTGKTFVGALLCDAILRHSSTERILVVCYTNHALDSFLESLIAKGITSIVRVGGRSKNEVGMLLGIDATCQCMDVSALRSGGCDE